MFVKKQEKDFEGLRDAIQAALNAPRIDVSGSSSSIDQLEKLANLLDRGVITDAEFQVQKAKLLVS
ncbi:hypothetical protein D3C72_2392060 [compost metagenome]